MKICVTPGCDNEIGERSITCLCKGCYSYIYTNQKRTIPQLTKHSNKIKLFQSRLNFILPAGHSKTSKEPTLRLLVAPGQVKKYRKRSKYKDPKGLKHLKAVV